MGSKQSIDVSSLLVPLGVEAYDFQACGLPPETQCTMLRVLNDSLPITDELAKRSFTGVIVSANPLVQSTVNK